jgi:ribosomal protein L3 glutamine methyltransferase
MSSPETVIGLIDRMSEQLHAAGVSFGHGTTTAFDEAAWLVLWQLGLPLDGLDDVAQQLPDATQKHAVEQLINKRISTRKPAAYLTGEAWLQGVPFTVDERVIVPRSLIAEPLVDGTLDTWLSTRTRTVLDLCTGNGSLAVLAAMAWPDVTVHATDISADALAVAQLNVKRHGLVQRIRLSQGDAFAAAQGEYDLILCNPPYVNDASMQALPAEYRSEPVLALAGGKDGMDFVRRLLRQAAKHMTEQAMLVLEIGNEREHFEACFPRLPVVWLPTSAGDDHVLLIDKNSLQ